MAILAPKQLKYRKSQRRVSRMKGVETRGTTLAFARFGLKALTSGWISAQQIESARKTILRYLKKQGKIWIRIFPHQPITSKSSGSGMGGGKGEVISYVAPVRKGRILFEVDAPEEKIARESLKMASYKLPIKTKFIKK